MSDTRKLKFNDLDLLQEFAEWMSREIGKSVGLMDEPLDWVQAFKDYVERAQS